MESPAIEKKESGPEKILGIGEVLNSIAQHSLLLRDSGNNGIIFEVDSSNIQPEIIEDLKKAGVNLEVGPALKLLKVYRPGQGLHEYECQRTVWQLLEAKDECAKAPEPLFYHDLSLSEETRKSLEGKVGHKIQPRVEILLMDFIDGTDIYCQLLKEVIRTHPETVDLMTEIDNLSLKEMEQRVAQALKFEIPGSKSRDEDEKEFEKQKVFKQNANRIYNYLLKNGRAVNPTVLSRLANSFEALAANKIIHGDAHERNFMVTGDMFDQEDSGEVYLIDFGATVLPGEQNHIAEHERRPDDLAVLRHLEKISNKSILNATSQQYFSSYERYKSHQRFRGIIPDLKEAAEFSEPDLASKATIKLINGDLSRTEMVEAVIGFYLADNQTEFVLGVITDLYSRTQSSWVLNQKSNLSDLISES
jgi:tRNA A-37 threonylcarbamoyl transferase component Bud32